MIQNQLTILFTYNNNNYCIACSYIDINECDSSPCQNSGICTDGVNSYSCACRSGYTGLQCQTSKFEFGFPTCEILKRNQMNKQHSWEISRFTLHVTTNEIVYFLYTLPAEVIDYFWFFFYQFQCRCWRVRQWTLPKWWRVYRRCEWLHLYLQAGVQWSAVPDK